MSKTLAVPLDPLEDDVLPPLLPVTVPLEPPLLLDEPPLDPPPLLLVPSTPETAPPHATRLASIGRRTLNRG